MADAAISARSGAEHGAAAAEGMAIPLGGGDEAGVLRAPPAAMGAEALPPDEIVEPGRALALADFAPPSLSAGERLIRFAYRMGVPASALTAPLGKSARLRLLATVLNPLPGNKVAGTALRAG